MNNLTTVMAPSRPTRTENTPKCDALYSVCSKRSMVAVSAHLCMVVIAYTHPRMKR